MTSHGLTVHRFSSTNAKYSHVMNRIILPGYCLIASISTKRVVIKDRYIRVEWWKLEGGGGGGQYGVVGPDEYGFIDSHTRAYIFHALCAWYLREPIYLWQMLYNPGYLLITERTINVSQSMLLPLCHDIKDGIIHHSLPRFEGASNWNIFHLRDGIDIIWSH